MLLVSMVVVLGLFTFQDVVLRQTTRVFAKVDATQRARTRWSDRDQAALEPAWPRTWPRSATGSTGTSLTFVSEVRVGGEPDPGEAHDRLDRRDHATLTDSSYAVTGGSSPNWTFSSTPSSTRTLLDHVQQVGSTPVFRYYKYGIAADSGGNQYLDAAGNPFMVLLDGTATLPSGSTTSTGGNVPANTIPYNSAADRSRLAAPLTTAPDSAQAGLRGHDHDAGRRRGQARRQHDDPRTSGTRRPGLGHPAPHPGPQRGQPADGAAMRMISAPGAGRRGRLHDDRRADRADGDAR